MTPALPRRILLVGAGRHAERIYLPLLAELEQRREVELVGLVELASRKADLERVFAGNGITPPPLTFLTEESDEQIVKALRQLHAEVRFDTMLVTCDPLHRAPYFDFACQSRVAVFVDKPVFALADIATDPAVAVQYVERLVELEKRVSAAGIDFVVQTQRRAHAGYRAVHELIDAAVARFNVPVTSIHIQHADGMWVLPDEWERDHHPYKFGFGKIFHSGYHFVDLLAFLTRSTLVAHKVTELEVAVKATFPEDSLRIWGGHSHLTRTASTRDRTSYGEHDVHALLDFRAAGQTVCVADLALLQNSFSDRDPAKPVTDSYKGIGRVRHERVDVKLSSILNLQVHSYQSRSTREPAGAATGEADHFELLIFRNSSFFTTEPPFEKISLAQLAPHAATAHNEHARGAMFTKFLRGERTGSELRDHLFSGELSSFLYGAIAASRGRLAVARTQLTLATR